MRELLFLSPEPLDPFAHKPRDHQEGRDRVGPPPSRHPVRRQADQKSGREARAGSRSGRWAYRVVSPRRFAYASVEEAPINQRGRNWPVKAKLARSRPHAHSSSRSGRRRHGAEGSDPPTFAGGGFDAGLGSVRPHLLLVSEIRAVRAGVRRPLRRRGPRPGDHVLRIELGEMQTIFTSFIGAAGGRVAGVDVMGDWSPPRVQGSRILHVFLAVLLGEKGYLVLKEGTSKGNNTGAPSTVPAVSASIRAYSEADRSRGT